jgi:hypothetical protein
MLSCERTGSCSFKWHFSNLIPSHKRRASCAECMLRKDWARMRRRMHAQGPACWSNFTKVGLFRSGYDLKFLQFSFFPW